MGEDHYYSHPYESTFFHTHIVIPLRFASSQTIPPLPNQCGPVGVLYEKSDAVVHCTSVRFLGFIFLFSKK